MITTLKDIRKEKIKNFFRILLVMILEIILLPLTIIYLIGEKECPHRQVMRLANDRIRCMEGDYEYEQLCINQKNKEQ